MKILVIGNGFIGASIIQKLESDGHELLVFSKSYKSELKCRQLTGDIFLFEEFERVLSWKPQIIIHTAWITAHAQYVEDSSNYKYSEFTSDLANYISHTDVEQLIILGTCAEYGPRTMASTAGITELNPISLYAKQKVAAFNSAKNSLHSSNVRFTWARIFQPYGPHQDRKRLLPYLIDSIREGRQLDLKDTSTVLDWITTRDIASAISWIVNFGAPLEVDIGTSLGFTNLEILEHLESLIGESHQAIRLAQHTPTSNQVILVGKDSPLFRSGWLPQDSLDSGLKWILQS